MVMNMGINPGAMNQLDMANTASPVTPPRNPITNLGQYAHPPKGAAVPKAPRAAKPPMAKVAKVTPVVKAVRASKAGPAPSKFFGQ